MIYTVTLNPALDKTLQVSQFAVDRVNRVKALQLDPGGKGINVSKVLHALGQPSMALGFLGGETGDSIARRLAAMGIQYDFVRINGETRTNLKIVDPQSGTYTDINEPGPVVTAGELAKLEESLFARLQPGDRVVLAGRAPAGVPGNLPSRWGARCKQAGTLLYADLEGALLADVLAAGPQLVKPNEVELCQLAGKTISTVEGFAAAAQTLQRQGCAQVVVSLGARGALFVAQEGTYYAPGLAVAVQSTVGAGDAMVAALCDGAQRRLPFCEQARWAMAVSAAKVMQPGSAPPTMQQAKALLPQVKLQQIS